MHPQTIFTKTAKGVEEIRNKTIRMPRDVGLVFLDVDGKRTFADLLRKASMDESGLASILDTLVADGYIKVFLQPAASPRVQPPQPEDDLDLDFTSPEVIARINNQARVQARTEAEAKARAEKAAQETVAAKAREDAEARAYELAQAKAKVEAEAKARAEAAAADAERVRARAEADIRAATEARARAEAEVRMRAAAEAKAKADAEAELRTAAEAKVRLEVEAARQAAANARTEADARARAEAEARARAEAESRAREIVEARLHAMEARLRDAEERANAEAEARAVAERTAREEAQAFIRKAHEDAEASVRQAREEAQASIESERKARTEAQAQTEAERQLREEALKKAQEEMEAQLEDERRLRAEAIKKAREEAEVRARAEIEERIQVERKAREEAEFRLQVERQAREEAERRGNLEIQARLEAERAARAEAEAKAAEVAAASAAAARLMREAASKSDSDAHQLKEQADRIAGTARRAHADAIARAQAEMMARVRAEQEAISEKRTFVMAQERAEETAIALADRERAARVRAEQEAMAKVDAEMKTREQAEMEADAKARAEAQKRAEVRAAQIQAELRAAREAAARARPPVPWGRIAAAGAVALIAAVVGLLHVVPFPVGGTEKLLSDRLQEPVRIGSLHFAVYPSPRWKLERITVGNGEDIKIGEASAPATSLGSSGARHLDEVQLSAVTIDQDAASRMAAWVKPQAGDPGLRVDSLRVSGIALAIRDLKLPIFDATIALAGDGSLKSVLLRERTLGAELASVKEGEWTGKFKGKGWHPPVAEDLEFGDLSGDVRILPGRISISNIDGTLYGGSIKGEATVKWGSQMDADGQFSLAGVDLGRLLTAMGSGFSASGLLDSKMRFTSQGLRTMELVAAPRLIAAFSVRKGLLNNVDLLRSVQSSGHGGKTPFDEITGELQVTGNRFIYRNVALASAALKASGSVDVLPNSELSGRIGVQVGTKTVTVASRTLNVGGNVKSPVLVP